MLGIIRINIFILLYVSMQVIQAQNIRAISVDPVHSSAKNEPVPGYSALINAVGKLGVILW
ncbi:hypothetical protein GKA92_17775 [Salmonella enterica subsp. enterica]|nr:hypothetical protein [Salmonella enterica subsp. enterica serovar Abaetetuba]